MSHLCNCINLLSIYGGAAEILLFKEMELSDSWNVCTWNVSQGRLKDKLLFSCYSIDKSYLIQLYFIQRGLKLFILVICINFYSLVTVMHGVFV